MRKKSVPKPRPRTRLKNTRDKGDWVEMMFMAKATRQGLIVSRPFGMQFFDFVVGTRKGPLFRVQVKSAWVKWRGIYRFPMCGGHRRRYERGEVDFVIGYLVPEDTWYVIPFSEITGETAYIFPGAPGTRSRWVKFREAWGLLRGEEPGYGIEIQACAESSRRSSVDGRRQELTTEDTVRAVLMELPGTDAAGCYLLEQTLAG